jgi:cation diffusion facilitator family transporter
MEHSSKKVIYAAFAGNCLIALTKFIAAFMTGSSAILSEGIHSVVDTGNQMLLLYGIARAKQPPDEEHPFGHGKELYFWNFMVAMLIFAIGAGVAMYEGILHLLKPNPVESGYINYIVLGLALVIESGSWYVAVTEFTKQKGVLGYIEAIRQGKDPSMFMVLFEDTAAMLGLLVAFIGILLGHLTGSPYFDGAASVLIGFILGGVAIWLAYETKGLLIGESAQKHIIQGIREMASSYKAIEQVNEILTMHLGPDFILVNLSADFVDAVSAADVEQTIQALDTRIKATYPEVKRLFIEAESRQTTESAG